MNKHLGSDFEPFARDCDEAYIKHLEVQLKHLKAYHESMGEALRVENERLRGEIRRLQEALTSAAKPA